MSDIEDGEVVVMLRQNMKRGGELMATYQMDYPDLASALREIGSNLAAGRVEAMTVAGRHLSDDEIIALTGDANGS
jgi:hypothetical protein